MDEIEERFPRLAYLSLMRYADHSKTFATSYRYSDIVFISRNPCCPGLMNVSSPDLDAYRLYRLYIFYRLPDLITLDWADGTDEVGSITFNDHE